MTPYRLLRVFAVLMLAGAPSQSANAQSVKAEGLRGLDSVRVIVEDLGPKELATGLSDKGLQTKVELELRKAGIRVYESRTGPYVYVNVSAVSAQTQSLSLGFAYNVAVEVYRYVLPVEELAVLIVERGPPEEVRSVVPAMEVLTLAGKGRFAAAWSLSVLGIAPADEAQDRITKAVVSSLEQFMNDYLSVRRPR